MKEALQINNVNSLLNIKGYGRITVFPINEENKYADFVSEEVFFPKLLANKK